MRVKSSIILALAVVGTAAFSNSVEASFILRITPTGGPTVTIADGSTVSSITLGVDGSATPGRIVYNDPSGDSFEATATNSPGTASLAKLTITSTNFSVATNYTIEITSTDFTLPDGPNLTFTSSFAGNAGQTGAADFATFQAYADTSNTPFGEAGGTVYTPGLHSTIVDDGTPDHTTHRFTTPDKFTSFDAIVPTSNPYSLTSVLTFTVTPGADINLTGTANIRPTTGGGVPEPATLGLIGVGGLFLIRRRKPC